MSKKRQTPDPKTSEMNFLEFLDSKGFNFSLEQRNLLIQIGLLDLNKDAVEILQKMIWKKADELRAFLPSREFIPIIAQWLSSAEGIQALQEAIGRNIVLDAIVENQMPFDSLSDEVKAEVKALDAKFYRNTEAVFIALIFVLNVIWLLHDKQLEPSASVINTLLAVLYFLKTKQNE
jgi:hypothetical protein